MGVLKFRLTPPDLSERLPDLKRAYITGLDRTPERMNVELRPGLMICHREAPESGRMHVPWPVPGVGVPFVATATLVERAEPYDLAVELARGKLNDVRTQAFDWVHLGLKLPAEVEQDLSTAKRSFAKAATSRNQPELATKSAQEALAAAFRAGKLLSEAYTVQVLRKRTEGNPKLPSLLACGLQGDPSRSGWGSLAAPAFNAGRIRCSWADLAPGEGQFRWAEFDAQLDWCRKQNWLPMAGPLLDLRPTSLPDWLWLWAGDPEAITTMVLDLVRQAVTRYKGLVATWHLVARPATGEVLGLNEEEQIRLTARVLQVARQIDPATPMIVDFDRPWAEWLGQSNFQLGPLHLADSLSRAEIGLSGVGLEIAPGYGPPGSHLRDIFEFSKLLDLYALLNLPLYVSLAIPSAAGPDPKAEKGVSVELGQWPKAPDESMQRSMAQSWIALAMAKPFVRSVCWRQVSDAEPHLFPHAGLFRPDGQPKALLPWLQDFRKANLA